MTELKTLNPPERSRIYTFADGQQVEFKNVVKVGVSESGNHRLETADGKKHIVTAGFAAITLDADEWTF